MIYIVIPVFNRLSKTVSCISSILQHCSVEFRIIIVDDGSSDGTSTFLENNYPQVVILKGDGSLFWTGAVKVGIDYVLDIHKFNDWVLLMNNDVQIQANTIENLLYFAKEKNRHTLTNALSVDLLDGDTIIKSGTKVLSWALNMTKHVNHGNSLRNLLSLDAIEVDLLTGRCLLHPVEIFREIGGYNPDLLPHYGGDDEFTSRARANGYKLYVLPSAIVFLDQEKSCKDRVNIFRSFTSIKSNINLIFRWRLTRSIVPFCSQPTYYLISVFKSVIYHLKND